MQSVDLAPEGVSTEITSLAIDATKRQANNADFLLASSNRGVVYVNLDPPVMWPSTVSTSASATASAEAASDPTPAPLAGAVGQVDWVWKAAVGEGGVAASEGPHQPSWLRNFLLDLAADEEALDPNHDLQVALLV